MKKYLLYLIVTVLVFPLSFQQVNVIFEIHPQKELQAFNNTYWSAVRNGTDYLTFYLNTSNRIINLTIYLADLMSFTTPLSSSSSNATFTIDANNASILYITNASNTISIVDNQSLYFFNVSINSPNNIEVPWNAIFEFWVNTSGPPINKSYIVGVDGVIPLRSEKRVKYNPHNRTYPYKLDLNVSDSLLVETKISVIYNNSSHYQYFDNTTGNGYLLLTRIFNNKTQTNTTSYQNISYTYNTTFLVLKNKTTGRIYYTTTIINDDYYMLYALITNTTTNQEFLGLILFNKTNLTKFEGMYNIDEGKYITQYNNLRLNITLYNAFLGTFTEYYNNITIDDLVNNTQRIWRNVYDGNYSIIIESKDIFWKNTSWDFITIRNNETSYKPTINSVNISNGETIFATPLYIEVSLSDVYAENSTCSLYVNATLADKKIHLGSGKHTLFKDFTSQPGFYTLDIVCMNDFGLYDSKQVNVTIIDMPDLQAKLVEINPLTYKKGDNVYITYIVSNNGTLPANNVYANFVVCSDASCNNILFNDTTSIGTLNANQYVLQSFNYTLKDTEPKYVKININTSSNDWNWSNQNISKTLNPTFKLNYTTPLSTTSLDPGTNISVYLNVYHYEGIPIKTLSSNNITLYDYWDYINKYRSMSYTFARNFNNGTYLLYYITPNISNTKPYYEYGTHKIILEAKKENHKAANTTAQTYSLNAPFLEISLSSPSSLEKDTTSTASISLTNKGSITVQEAYITVKVQDSNKLTIDGNAVKTCYFTTSNISNTCSFTLKGVNEGSTTLYVSTKLGETYFKPNALSVPPINATVGFYAYPSKSITITAPQQQEEQQTTTTTDSTQQQTEESSETQSSEDNSTTTTQQEEKEAKISLKTDKTTYSFYTNESTEITIILENTGEKNIEKIELYFEYDKNNLDISANITQMALKSGEKKEIKATITSPTQKVGIYAVQIEAKYEDKSETTQINVRVEPTEDDKKEIESTMQKLKEEIEKIDPPEGLKVVYEQTQQYLQEAEEKIKEGNYVEAYMLLEKAKNNLDVLKESADIQEGGSNIIIWILIILVVLGVVGGIAYYLLTPPKSTYHPSKGYSFNPQAYEDRRQAYINKLKEAISRKLK